MMKAFGFLFLLLLIGTTAFVYLSCSTKGSTASSSGSRNAMILTMKSRKLKDNIDSPSPYEDEDEDDDIGQVNLEDYRPFDPVPSSTASIRPGPIEHATPLMPFIPKPSPPPTQSKHVDVGFP